MEQREQIIADEGRYVTQSYKRQPVVFTRGEGCYLFDSDGKRYLDLVAGVAVNSVGHSHPRWIAAVDAQLRTLTHTSNLYYTTPMVELAKRLVQLSGLSRVFFCNSGTEANEAAIKIARKWGKITKGDDCHRIVTFEGAFHGRTLGALSATGQKKYSEPFEPLVPGFVKLPLYDRAALERELSSQVCAVMIEPIQGESGVWPIRDEFLHELRALCDQRDILLIFDEVQTGIGRTGTWFGFQHTGILPDLLPLAKGLGGGVPVGACVVGSKAAEVLAPGDHGSTFAGSPFAASAALAVLDIIESEGLLESVRATGQAMMTLLSDLQARSKALLSPRGKGLMIGVDLTTPIARNVVQRGLQNGALFNATGDATLRFVPPLIMNRSQADEAIEKLAATVKALS